MARRQASPPALPEPVGGCGVYTWWAVGLIRVCSSIYSDQVAAWAAAGFGGLPSLPKYNSISLAHEDL